MEEAGGHTLKSYVRGKVVDFSSENLRNVIRFRAQVQGAVTDFETRKEHDQQLDQVLADLCIPGATWKLSTGQLRVPIQLRRQELNPVARGWHEFSIHSLIPSSNRSEIPQIRAILIHCIMRGIGQRVHVIHGEATYNVRNLKKSQRAHVIRELPHVQCGQFGFNVRFQQRLHIIRGSYTYNMEAILNFSIFSNSNSNPRSFGYQFHSLIKGIIGRIKRRLIED
ncbi:hypothetical protein PIB30_100020 [Stylosanthes scabra]|uniref:Putative plant transposon protein domain-containing protein n=1 Tax=Stylosanthes scabra TaxID=79078 RepID=A0ABU6SXM2_9FABA|nr:hypothetical protein [Stylosanthes scabra]